MEDAEIAKARQRFRTEVVKQARYIDRLVDEDESEDAVDVPPHLAGR